MIYLIITICWIIYLTYFVDLEIVCEEYILLTREQSSKFVKIN
jgi:hypothetical protein